MKGQGRRSTSGRWAVGSIAGALALIATLQVGLALQEVSEVEPDSTAAARIMSADSVDLSFEREVFTYPAYGRRNPFRPLTGEDMGPRFEDLTLTGVLVSLDRSRSIATVGERPAGSTQPPERHHRLREGDVVGNSRIIEIRERWVTVQVEEFGLFELRTLELVRTAPLPVPGSNPPAAAPTAEPAPEEAEAAGETPAPTPPVQGMRHDSPNGNGGWS